MQIAMHNAEVGKPVLFVSLEMKDRELIQRVLCSRASVNQRRIRNGTLTADDRRALVDAAGEVYGLLFRVWSPARATIQDIRAAARLEQKTAGLSLLIIDYLTLIAGDERESFYEKTTKNSNAIKRLAKELEVPVIVLAQLNRESEKSKSRPTLANLGQSGAIEQDADIVMFLHREHRERPETELLVAKHRHGVEGMVQLDWIGHETRFADRT